MQHKILTTLFFLISIFLFGQNQAILKGTIKDTSGKAIEKVSIYIADSQHGTISNATGTYELKIPANKQVLVVFSHTSFETQYRNIELKANETLMLSVAMLPQTKEIEEVVVASEREREINQTRLSAVVISKLPGTSLGGIMTSIKTLPGVSSNSELSSQYKVRGGNFDENIIYVNNIPIYKPQLVRSGQQEGLSFVNSDMVSSLTFSSGGFDACYRDKTSSVLDITYKKPSAFEARIDLNLMGAAFYMGGVNKKKTGIS
ncbi:MAG: carboxypeptidase-like regulatory domain-containing protein [Bacteroidales bacterium]|nr:carboxypeptidase-like regulatory domain-containing protein [Bacteroidales bacterium]